MQLRADLDHAVQRRRPVGPGIHRPDTNVFFTEKQPLTLVIGDATFRLAVDAELAHQLPLHYTVRGAEAVLQIAPVLAIGERSEERRVGQEGVSTGSFRWSPYPSQKNNTN